MDYIEKNIVQPLIKKMLEPIAKKIMSFRFTFKRAISILIVLVFSVLFFLYYQDTVYCFEAITNKNLYIKDKAKIDTLISDLSKSVSDDYNNLRGDDLNNAWGSSQMLISIFNEDKIDTGIYFDFSKMNKLTNGTFDEQKPPIVTHYASTGWVLSTFGLLHYSMLDSTILAVLRGQLSEGGWPMYPTNDQTFGSTYATAYILSGLTKISPYIIDPSIKDSVDRHVHTAINWIKESQDNETKLWKDYPNYLSTDSKLSKPLTSIVLHTLKVLGQYTSSDVRDFILRERNLYDNGILTSDISAVYYPKTQRRDATIVNNYWQLLSLKDMYESCSIPQKIIVLRYLNKEIDNIDLFRIKQTNIWNKSELLIVLRHLRDNYCII